MIQQIWLFCSSYFRAVIIVVIIIIIAVKGAIRELLQSPHCAANCLQYVSSSVPGTVVCKSHAP